MDDLAPVGVIERFGHLNADLQALGQRQVLLQALEATQMVAQAAAIDILHGDEQAQFRIAEVVDANDRRVIELRRRACLLHQSGAKLLQTSEVAVHQLDGHLPLQIEVGGAIDRAHAAVAQQGFKVIAIVQGLIDQVGHPSLLGRQQRGRLHGPRQNALQPVQQYPYILDRNPVMGHRPEAARAIGPQPDAGRLAQPVGHLFR